jgi:hypothetical protein
VPPVVVQAMREAGVDLGLERPRLPTRDVVNNASLLVRIGGDEAYPFHKAWPVHGLEIQDWTRPDPAGQPK